MADTQRTVNAILALLADNTDGDISPQDIRDAFTTWRMGHGQIYVAAADAAAVSITDTTSYFEATAPTWTLSSGALWLDESGGNGRLTYTGAVQVAVHIACTVSFTAANNNRTIHLRIGKNGTTDAASEVQRRIATGTDVGSTALHLVTTMTTNDYISLFARNSTSADNVTIQCANIQLTTMPA